MRRAVESGQNSPPIDLRFLERPLDKLNGDSSRAQVVSFLEGLYNSVAETLPDVKDDTQDISFEHHAGDDACDAYAEALNNGLETVTAPTKGNKRMRKKIKSVQITEGRRPRESGEEIRWLPPGSIKEYWEQLRANDSEKNISFSYFWRVSWLQF